MMGGFLWAPRITGIYAYFWGFSPYALRVEKKFEH